MSERDLMHAIQLEASRRGWRLFRNNTAMAWVGERIQTPSIYERGAVILLHARPLHAGLCMGSSDLIGWKPGGQFTAIEVKLPGKKSSPEQHQFLDAVNRAGGDGRVIDNLTDL